jgi:lipoic acid synthetase
VRRWVEPAEFEQLAAAGRDLGLGWVESGPLVRSSYHAREQAEAGAGGQDSPGAAGADAG